MTMPRVFIALDPAGGAFTLAFYQGLTLLILSGAGWLAGRRRIHLNGCRGVLLIGLSMGVTSVPNTAFITMALKYLAGAVVYPLRSVVNVLGVFILSFLLFKERVRPVETVGSAMALAGIVLVSATLS
jgi:multidrug transporter EmrE-like cation transporter